jgi:hemolysin activation/secretion protein
VGDRVSLTQLNESREKIDRHYREKGYLSSGSLLLSQELSAGKIEIQVVETILSEILITGDEGLSQEYLKSQLPATGEPLNYDRLTKALVALENNPLIQDIEGEIVQNSFGSNSLLVKIVENDPVTLSIGLNNAYSPGIGSFGGNARLTHLNLLGVRDRLTVERSQTEGLSRTGASYSFPFNRQEGKIAFAYNNADSRVVEEAVSDFGITADYESLTVAIVQPVVNTPSEVFSLGIGIEHIDSETFVLDDRSFAFTPGLENGESKSTVLRLTQEYARKGDGSLWEIQSQFNLGLDVLDTTKTAQGIDGLFWSWTGGMRYLKSLNTENNHLFLATLNLQLTPDKLLPTEKITIGGLNKGTGYRPNIGVADNGVIGTLELQFSLAESDSWGKLSIGPFIHGGTIWNSDRAVPAYADRATTEANDFLSAGMSLQYRVNFLELRLDYGLPLIELENFGATDTEDNFSFSLLFRPL